MAAPESLSSDPPESSRFETLLERFTRGWRKGAAVPIETLLAQVAADQRPDAFLELLLRELTFRRSAGEQFLLADYQLRFPQYAAQVAEAFDQLAHSAAPANHDSAGEHHRTEVYIPGESPEADEQPAGPLPDRIETYEIRRELGRGGFGMVYLGYDPKLQREVAIKVPRIARGEQSSEQWNEEVRVVSEAWLKEARIVAQLDHPHIVPVLHVGSIKEFPAFIVSKYIDGCSLAERLQQSPLPLVEAVDLLIDVAEALDYAHRSRDEVVHRDIKPGNLLLDQQGKVYVADFGLALRESDPIRERGLAGTPAYMSPEQVRGEGHLVDGRSDIFSLGVVLYELLTGRRPFRGQRDDLLTEILKLDPKPPRQLNAAISPELERICLKALAKLASERYSTARDLAADLRLLRATEWLPGMAHTVVPTATPISPNTPPNPPTPVSRTPGGVADSHPSPAASPQSSRTVAIVPKGLRSFDASDSGFFLELLPGARDRTGLPDSIRFWKERIEQTVGARPLRVGLLTGPSGCGKSSLVKAGLLPRLADEILPIYLEATTDDTDRRIVALLHRHLPKLERIDNLADCLTAVRRGQAGLGRRKLLLVIDQFEQWLNAHQGEDETLLTRALRQCDGERLQCLVLVRDDFALAVYGFLRQLEIPLVQGENSAVVDRFGLDHARRVLTAFGRALGQLPPEPAELSLAQQQFVDQAIDSLAEQHRVVPVRLALFAEMFKQRPWTPDALVQVGGAEGVGRVFLEETFRSDTAPPQYRLHAKGAQRVLAALLPQVGSDIKGHRRSRDELLAAAGYTQRPAEGAELLRILDGELRLISPVESASDGFDTSEDTAPLAPGGPGARSTDYHLTHDYLVPSLRRWVEDILGSTPAGRAKLLLRERSRLWNDRPLNRNLPSVAEHLRIRRWVPVAERSGTERALLAQSARVHGRWGVFAVAGMVLLAVGAGWLWQERRQREAVAQVQVLESAVASDWNRTFDTLRRDGLTKLAERPLRQRLTEAEDEGDTLKAVKMRTGLLATQGDTSQAKPLGQALLTLPAAEFGVVRELLAAAPKFEVVAALWDQATDQQNRSAQQRFQALAALARLAPEDARWTDLTAFIVRHLVSLPADELVAWRPLFEPIGDAMTQALASLLGDSSLDTAVGRAAAETLSFYSTDSGPFVAKSLLQSEPQRFEVLWGGVVAKNSAQVAKQFESVLAEPVPSTATEEELEALNIRKSRAAAGLVRMGQPDKVWPLLVFDPQPDDPQTQDPSLRTEVLHALSENGVPVQRVVDRLVSGLQDTPNNPRDAHETSIQRALLLALGSYTVGMSENARQTIIQRLQLQSLFETDPDPGIHSACELLLRRWGEQAWLQTAQEKLKAEAQHPPAPQTNEPRRWFVNKHGQTFVVFAPGMFTMGSPENESGRFDGEYQHPRRIERSFAIATTEVTCAQYAVYAKEEEIQPMEISYSNKTDADPQTRLTWYDAARYCNWLSRREGITPCYQVRVSGQDVTVTIERNFLDLAGYRLPIEAEWEYACRAGAGVAWGHGRPERRLGQYAWFLKTSNNHLWPVGTLLPNEAGLFDMSGNAWEWCQDLGLPYPQEAGEHAKVLDDAMTVEASTDRVLRGGSVGSTFAGVRAANRSSGWPVRDDGFVSFRLSRTYP